MLNFHLNGSCAHSLFEDKKNGRKKNRSWKSEWKAKITLCVCFFKFHYAVCSISRDKNFKLSFKFLDTQKMKRVRKCAYNTFKGKVLIIRVTITMNGKPAARVNLFENGKYLKFSFYVFLFFFLPCYILSRLFSSKTFKSFFVFLFCNLMRRWWRIINKAGRKRKRIWAIHGNKNNDDDDENDDSYVGKYAHIIERWIIIVIVISVVDAVFAEDLC